MTFDKLTALGVVGFVLGGVFAWFSNLIWLFRHLGDGLNVEAILSLIGVLVAPVGVLHGVYTWLF